MTPTRMHLKEYQRGCRATGDFLTEKASIGCLSVCLVSPTREMWRALVVAPSQPPKLGVRGSEADIPVLVNLRTVAFMRTVSRDNLKPLRTCLGEFL